MNDLISRSALLLEFDEYIRRNREQDDFSNSWCADVCEVLRDTIIKVAPAVEAVPVVRCGECERRIKSADLTFTIYCPWFGQQMDKTDFCSYGERRNGDG